MSGLHFIHPGFVIASLAVAIPLIIHLLFRQKSRTVVIGSVRFLRKVVREHQRRRWLRQWILLALRCLAALLLAILFARPYWNQDHLQPFHQEIVILLDRSASMAVESDGATSFDRARKEITQQLSSIDSNVVVHLATFDATGIDSFKLESLRSMNTSEAATDFGLALSWARDTLQNSGRRERSIFLYSDLQRSGLPKSPIILPPGVQLTLRDVGGYVARNLSIDSAIAIRTEIIPDQPVQLKVIVSNHGPAPVENLTLSGELEGPAGPVSANAQVSIGSHRRAVAELRFPLKDDGLYRGRVSLDLVDALKLDNQRWVAFESRHPERVLLVDGDEGRNIFNSETYYLEAALRIRPEESIELRSFEPERLVWESGEGFPNLDGYRAIVLANIRRFSDADAIRLKQFIERGGNVLLFVGDQTTPDNLTLFTSQQMLPGVPSPNPLDGNFRATEWSAEHPALACFSDPQFGDLRRISFDRILPLQLDADATSVLLRSGSHAIVAEQAVGKGRLVYFGSTADRDWTDLPRSPIYVPLMRQLIAYLTDQLANRSAVTDHIVSRPGERSGITELSVEPARWRVTNIDARESAMERCSEEDLRLMSNASDVHVTDETALAESRLSLPVDRLRPDEKWSAVVLVLLMIFCMETLLSSRVHA